MTLVTAEDYAPWGLGEPDADGWFPDYLPIPNEFKPAAPEAPKPKGPQRDDSLFALLSHWSLVVADLSRHHHVDLYDPAVLARPWVGIRTMIFSLLDEPTRLRAALMIQE